MFDLPRWTRDGICGVFIEREADREADGVRCRTDSPGYTVVSVGVDTDKGRYGPLAGTGMDRAAVPPSIAALCPPPMDLGHAETDPEDRGLRLHQGGEGGMGALPARLTHDPWSIFNRQAVDSQLGGGRVRVHPHGRRACCSCGLPVTCIGEGREVRSVGQFRHNSIQHQDG